MKIRYLGHSCLLIESGERSVIIDPFLSGNSNAHVSARDVRVDAVLITHGHMDHIGDSIEIAKRNSCKIVVIDELGKHLAKMDADVQIHPLSIGGAYQFDWGKVKLTQAFHGISVELGDELGYSMPTGILLTMNEKTLYHAGDTGLFGDMKLIGDINKIDFAALPIGGNFTMDIEDSIIAAKMLNAKKYMPIHYNTFDIIQQDDQEWYRNMSENNLPAVILESGQSISI